MCKPALCYCVYFSLKDDAVNIAVPVATRIFLTRFNVGLQARPSLTADFVCPTAASQLANTASLLPPADDSFLPPVVLLSGSGHLFPPTDFLMLAEIKLDLLQVWGSGAGGSVLSTHRCSHLPNGVPFAGPSLVHVAISHRAGARDSSQ